MYSIFLSHNHFDKPFAQKLAIDLRKLGVRVWIDEAEIRIGDSLIEKIREGIDQVDYVGVILSSHSVDSPWVKKEVDIAMNQEIEGRRVKVLPLLLEDCELPGFIKGKLYADFRNPKSYHTEFAKVANRLGVSVSGAPPNTDNFSSNAIRQIFQSWGKIAAYVFGIISIVVIITYWFNLQSLFINDTALREHVGYLSNLRKHFNKIPNPDFNLNLTNRELDYYWIDEIYTGTTWAEVFRKICRDPKHSCLKCNPNGYNIDNEVTISILGDITTLNNISTGKEPKYVCK